MPLWFSQQFHQCQLVADFFLSLSMTECLQVRVVLSRRHPTRSSPTHYGLTCWLKRIKIHKLESPRSTPVELDTVTRHSTVRAMLTVRWLGVNWREWLRAFLMCTHRVEGYGKWVRIAVIFIVLYLTTRVHHALPDQQKMYTFKPQK